ncbi:hypothetical protein HBI80_221140 [Parastagonospora nodorum]|nr:hypothetical protein HBI80_221140 [Parastagonospora nodorum]
MVLANASSLSAAAFLTIHSALQRHTAHQLTPLAARAPPSSLSQSILGAGDLRISVPLRRRPRFSAHRACHPPTLVHRLQRARRLAPGYARTRLIRTPA